MDSFDRALDYGNSQLDMRHRFVFSGLYQLPFGQGQRFGSGASRGLDAVLGGWQVNGILTLQSGFPFSVTDNWGRADLLCSPQTFANDPNHYFSTACFAPSPLNSTGAPLRPGTSGRNILFGPGLGNVDFSLFKDFRLTERLKLQYRAEFFNLSNWPHFANPVSYVFDSNFGRINNTLFNSQRQIQMALRLTF